MTRTKSTTSPEWYRYAILEGELPHAGKKLIAGSGHLVNLETGLAMNCPAYSKTTRGGKDLRSKGAPATRRGRSLRPCHSGTLRRADVPGAAISYVPVNLILLGLPVLIYSLILRRRGKPGKEILDRLGLRFASSGNYAWALVILVLTGVLAVWATRSIPEEVLRSPNVAVSQYGGLGLSAGAVLLVLVRETFYVALGEELLFRGLLGGILFRRLGFALGNALQTALFLLPHLALLLVNLGLWRLVLVQLLAGWLLGWLRFRSGSILPGWMAHSLTNASGAFAVLSSGS